ncbi:hypothetical protein [Streptomyces tsukubensis]|uniref:hypothetical protein n=1 Tax=Streptomyces tsukubensis TaxID=83656 RepID=UPI00344DA00A
MHEEPEPTSPPGREAEEAPPWRPEYGPGPVNVVLYQRGRLPGLWVYTRGEWRRGWVVMRHDYPDRRYTYHVELTLTDENGIPGTYSRTFWWGQDAVRVLRRPPPPPDASVTPDEPWRIP